VYTSAPAYLPDPLFDFSEGLVPRLPLKAAYVSTMIDFDTG